MTYVALVQMLKSMTGRWEGICSGGDRWRTAWKTAATAAGVELDIRVERQTYSSGWSDVQGWDEIPVDFLSKLVALKAAFKTWKEGGEFVTPPGLVKS